MLGRAQFIQLILFAPFASLGIASASQMPSSVNQGSAPESLVSPIFQRQLQKNSYIRQYAATVETRIQMLKPARLLLVLHPKQYHYVDRIALSRIEEFQEAAKSNGPGTFPWHLNRAAFVSQLFLDGPRFTQDNYRLEFAETDQRKLPGCHVFQVYPINAHRTRTGDSYFQGKVWVTPDDYTIIHFAGRYVPASHLLWLVEFHNFEFESSWVELQKGLWLPDSVITTNSGLTRDDLYPDFEAVTIFRDWKQI
ncbi:MAG TPA: hypothetical protein VFI38_15415 [Candidatus Acidoferrum sp.]|nr:hypothetical protein [Candidatus Acidoferrum sp.]